MGAAEELRSAAVGTEERSGGAAHVRIASPVAGGGGGRRWGAGGGA